MIEKAIPLTLPPGIYRNGTKYQAKNRWYSGNMVRWYEGIMGPIGGWRKILLSASSTPIQVTGKPRAAHGWRANNGLGQLVIGTQSKLYRYTEGAITDITPAAFVTGGVDGVFSAGNYGTGTYGTGPYGTGTGALTLTPPATWQLDNFGELLVATYTADGRIFSADPAGGAATALVAGTPTNNRAVVVTPEHFLVALGAGGIGRRVQWPDQESLGGVLGVDWVPVPENQAGTYDLPTKGVLVAGRRSRRQTILWTDVDAWAMFYIGGVGIYGFEQLGDNCGLIGPQAAVILGDRMFWMSHGKFFEYDGALKPLNCDVRDYVFGELDQSQRAKIQAIPMARFNEVWWTYPSAGRATYENDKYVSYNFVEQHWSLGTVARAAGIDRGVYEYPILVDPDGYLYEHEYGGSTRDPGAYAESGPLELGDGDKLLRVQQIIPDEKTQGEVTMTLYGSFYPNETERVVGPFVASNPTPTRITARQVRLRVDEVAVAEWRVGVPRLGVIPAGNR